MSVAWVHVLGACCGPRLMSVSQLLFSLFTEAVLPMNLNSDSLSLSSHFAQEFPV